MLEKEQGMASAVGSSRSRIQNGFAWVILLGVGSLSMAGNLFDLAPLRGVGLATAMSPAPKVFSAVRGLETYSTRFFLEWNTVDGEAVSVELTPEINANLRGPYNRRNVYGAVLAYGPVLPTELPAPGTRPARGGEYSL